MECQAAVEQTSGAFLCRGCGLRYPVREGTIRMLPRSLRSAPGNGEEALAKRRTGESFAYEWAQFGATRPEWHKNFVDYMRPHSPESLAGKRLLDVGTGSGRHARVATELGAD
ncbi:MAG: hypothetical protein ACRDKX_02175, partial [Solirubrobacterales bacterium]